VIFERVVWRKEKGNDVVQLETGQGKGSP